MKTEKQRLRSSHLFAILNSVHRTLHDACFKSFEMHTFRSILYLQKVNYHTGIICACKLNRWKQAEHGYQLNSKIALFHLYRCKHNTIENAFHW